MNPFGHKHYVPVLRWKRGERIAVERLFDVDKALLTPIVELMPRDYSDDVIKKFGGLDRRLIASVEDIEKAWGPSPFFLDLCHTGSLVDRNGDSQPVEVLCRESHARGLFPIPVTGVSKPAGYNIAIRRVISDTGSGACIRLLLQDFGNPSLAATLDGLLRDIGVPPQQVDLVVDIQSLVDRIPDYAGLCARIPRLREWRTFTLLSGAFTKDLTGFEKNLQHPLPRRDWTLWRDLVSAGSRPARLPSFGDYTVQYGLYQEIGPGFNASASIRYTTDEQWIIMRGEGVRNEDGPGFSGFLGNAQLLVDRPEFAGADFSFGDAYIYEMSLQDAKTGSLETWIRAGINHHLTFVARQVAS